MSRHRALSLHRLRKVLRNQLAECQQRRESRKGASSAYYSTKVAPVQTASTTEFYRGRSGSKTGILRMGSTTMREG